METRSLSAASMAQHNRDLILDVLRRQGSMSRAALRREVGASPATVNRLTTNLLERGLVLDHGMAPSTGGRPSIRLRFNERAAVVAAIDIGSTIVRGALVDLQGGVIEEITYEIGGAPGARRRLDDVRRLATRLVRTARAQREHCMVLAVGVPGVVDADGEVGWAPALGWHQVPLAQALGEACGLPTFVENDANALAVAEHRYGDARGSASLVALNLGNGIGAGIIADGSLYRGHNLAAGEVGYLLVEPSSLKQTYAGFGDLEGRIGAEAISTRAGELGLRDGSGEGLSAAQVFDTARRGDAQALALVEEICDRLAVAVANLATVLDPAVIVLGGGLGASADILSPRLARRLEGRIPQVPRLLPPSLGRRGVLIGVAELAVESLGSLDSLLPDAAGTSTESLRGSESK